MKKYLLVALLVGCSCFASAQNYLPFEQVKKYIRAQKPSKYDSSLNYLTNRLGIEMHYLYPLYQAVGWESKFKKTMGDKLFYQTFSQLLAFAGDHAMALRYNQKSFDTISALAVRSIHDTINRLKNIQYFPAKDAIVANAPLYRVIMLNEAHNNSIHRAFTYSLLEDLYKQGYTYLAMEALNNYSNKCLDSLNVFTGYYAMEPVMGELVRKALRLGYKLISYEDTLASAHSPSQRDSVQAENIYRVMQKDPSAKILVHAGYGHISEAPLGDIIPMGQWFRKISGMDPFTVNQTSMTEGGNFEYERQFYNYFNERFNISTPSIIYQNKRPFNPLGEQGYDVIVMHPATNYIQNRPDWLALNGERKATLIQPTAKMLFFVQAFYANEYDSATVNYRAPADQTYVPNKDGYYCLYLRKGKYTIVLRDVSYKIVGTKELDVQ